jgi:hypothetical protein
MATGRSISVLFINANLAARLERSVDRSREGHQRTLPELRALDQIHDLMGLDELEKLSGGKVLYNDGSIENYKRELLAALR